MAKKKEEPGASSGEVVTKEYAKTIADLKAQIQSAQVKAVVSANKEFLKLYWSIGQTISERRSKSGWGNNIVEQLAKDIQNAFPGIKGFSRRNIFRMQAFHGAYEKVPQAVAQIGNLPIFSIPWGHNIVLIERVKDQESRLWYAHTGFTKDQYHPSSEGFRGPCPFCDHEKQSNNNFSIKREAQKKFRMQFRKILFTAPLFCSKKHTTFLLLHDATKRKGSNEETCGLPGNPGCLCGVHSTNARGFLSIRNGSTGKIC